MKIGIIGASGKVGSLVAAEAARRGHEITAIVRDKNKIPDKNYKIIEKNLFDLTVEDINQLDAVVSAFGTPFDGSRDEEHTKAAEYLIKVFRDAPKTRILFVGGAASLYMDPKKEKVALETIPEEWRGVPTATAKGLSLIRKSGINWTYFSPALFFDSAGVATGSYIPGTEFVFFNKKGESYLSYADAAIAIVDELESNSHPQERFTAVSERVEKSVPQGEQPYYGILTKKPFFQGNSQYRQPFNYELSGKRFRFVMDIGKDIDLHFISGQYLEWAEGEDIPRKYYYECIKGDATTYFVNFELFGIKPRTVNGLIIDLEQRLVTFNKTTTDFHAKLPYMIKSEFDFGVIDMEGFSLPKIRHGYTMDLVGKRIQWNYSSDFSIVHVYYSPRYMRVTFPPGLMPPPSSEEDAARWQEFPYDEETVYIKIKKNMYSLNCVENNMTKFGGVGNNLFWLMDLERVRVVGRSFGRAPGDLAHENYLFTAVGKFVKPEGDIESVKSVYLPD
jgi:putative NADH-flavin reductase